MTEIEKNKVQTLRANGKTYAEISKILHINRNSIAAFCRRQNVDVKGIPKISEHCCKQCGMPVTQIPHRKEKKFCSDKCRMMWWNSHTELINHRQTAVCKYCGNEFKMKRKSQLFCSKSCAAKERYHEG